MQSRIRSRLGLWAILAIVVVALAAAGGASLASGDSSAGANTRTLHFLLREDQQVLDRAPAGPSNGDLVLLRGDLLNPKTRAAVGTELGTYVMVDAANQNRSVADVVFAPDARTNLAGADQITMETIFDSVPGNARLGDHRRHWQVQERARPGRVTRRARWSHRCRRPPEHAVTGREPTHALGRALPAGRGASGACPPAARLFC